MVEAFIDHVLQSQHKKLISVSSLVGSIALAFGGQTFYRASKAALNMSMYNLSMEFKRGDDPLRKQLIVGLISPGVVDTGFAKNVPVPMIQADEAARGLIRKIDSYTVDMSGAFTQIDDKDLPW